MTPHLRPGTVIVDCSTSDPTVTERLATDLEAKGVHFADAPLSRTPKEAWEGTLDCMVGADDAIFTRIKPVIATWAGKLKMFLQSFAIGTVIFFIAHFQGDPENTSIFCAATLSALANTSA